MLTGDRPLSLRAILAFWAPLAATWLMMAVEGPYLSSLVARMAHPVENLAAFGLAFTLAWLVESPIIMLLTAATALAKDGPSLQALQRFSWTLNAGVTALMALVVVPPIYDAIAQGLLGMPPHVAQLSRQAATFMLPWPAAIGFRRFYQGVMVRSHQTRRVAYGTLVRLGTMSLVAGLLAWTTALPGAWIGTLGLTSGVLAEALASRLMVAQALRTLQETPGDQPPPTLAELRRFYTPLALTSMIAMCTGPMLTFFMGQGASGLACLATWPVVHSFIFFFRSGGSAFQEVAVALGRAGTAQLQQVRRAGVWLAIGFSLLFAGVVLSPLGRLWFERVVGLGPELVTLALAGAQVALLLPPLEYLQSYLRARWVLNGQTRMISRGTAIELGVLTGVMALLVLGWGLTGTLAAALSLTLGRSAGTAFLGFRLGSQPSATSP